MSRKEEELAALNQSQRRAHQGRLSQDAHDRLKRIAQKKFRTCFIYALAQFEESFGREIWGHNLPDDMLTDDQRENRKIWEQVRKRILDKGNTQSRALSMELDLHEVRFKGYQMDFGGNPNG